MARALSSAFISPFRIAVTAETAVCSNELEGFGHTALSTLAGRFDRSNGVDSRPSKLAVPCVTMAPILAFANATRVSG
jgi:hypothetical protein